MVGLVSHMILRPQEIMTSDNLSNLRNNHNLFARVFPGQMIDYINLLILIVNVTDSEWYITIVSSFTSTYLFVNDIFQKENV